MIHSKNGFYNLFHKNTHRKSISFIDLQMKKTRHANVKGYNSVYMAGDGLMTFINLNGESA